MLTYSRRHGFVGTNAFQRDDSSEEDSSSEQDYILNRKINYTGLCFQVSSQMPCTDGTSMDIVEEDMTFYRAQEGSTCSGYDLDVFGCDLCGWGRTRMRRYMIVIVVKS
jgi:hypothetical protein